MFAATVAELLPPATQSLQRVLASRFLAAVTAAAELLLPATQSSEGCRPGEVESSVPAASAARLLLPATQSSEERWPWEKVSSTPAAAACWRLAELLPAEAVAVAAAATVAEPEVRSWAGGRTGGGCRPGSRR